MAQFDDICFSGTRDGMTPQQMRTFSNLARFLRWRKFRHGSCRGADVEAARIVRGVLAGEVTILAYPGRPSDPSAPNPTRADSGVDDRIFLEEGFLPRDRKMVDVAKSLVACPRQMARPKGQRIGGTWYTIGYGMQLGRPLLIIRPDGSIEAH